MVMEYLTRRNRRRQRTDTDVRSSSSIEVISIIRTQPFHWVAVAEYHYNGGIWVESITFVVTPDHAHTPPMRIVAVSDTDFEGDRTDSLVIDYTDNRSMPQVILDFLQAGRW